MRFYPLVALVIVVAAVAIIFSLPHSTIPVHKAPPNDTTPPMIIFVPPTHGDGAVTFGNSTDMKISLIERYLDNFIFNWDGTNYSMYDEGLLVMLNFDNISELGENIFFKPDLSLYGNNATCVLNNCSTGVYVNKRNAIYLDGVNEYLTLGKGNNLDNLMESTSCAWIYPKGWGSTAYGRIFDKFSYALSLDNNGSPPDETLYFNVHHSLGNLNVAGAPNMIKLNEWQHVCVTWDGSNSTSGVKLYVNGVESASYGHLQDGNGSRSNDTNYEMKIGSSYLNSSFYDGYLDEIRIFNRSLGASEIVQLYNSNLRKFSSDEWEFTSTQLGLTEGAHTYYGYVDDLGNNTNQTEVRTLFVDTLYTNIGFVYPTHDDDAAINNDWAYVKADVSTTENPRLTAFVDWNRNLLGWWTLNENSGQVVEDSSTNSNSGTLGPTIGVEVEDPTWTLGKFGSGLHFDGNDDYVDLGIFDVSGDEMTISARIRFEGFDGQTQSKIVSKSDGPQSTDNIWSFGLYNSSGVPKLGFEIEIGFDVPSVLLAAEDIPLNTWIHAVAVYNGTDMLLYKNGTLINITTNVSGDVGVNNSVGVLLGTSPLSSYFFNGTIDDVQVWDRALSQVEIRALYDAGSEENELLSGFTGLVEGDYEYTAYLQNITGFVQQTDTRNIKVDTTLPTVGFVSPTDPDGTNLDRNWIEVNVSVSDDSTKYNLTSFIDWDKSLVGWWNMNEVLGQGVEDMSSYGNDGVLGGSINVTSEDATWTTGRFGYGLKFDGTDDRVQIPDSSSLSFSNLITIEVWIKPGFYDNWRTILSKFKPGAVDNPRKDIYLYIYDNQLGLALSGPLDDDWNTSVSVDTNEWNHFVVTYDGTSIDVYKNGIYSATMPATGVLSLGLPDSTEELYIGYNTEWQGSEVFNGTIDEVKIWNRILSSSEIKASYNAGVNELSNTYSGLTQKTYDYIAYVQDMAGNVNKTETRTYTYYSPPPQQPGGNGGTYTPPPEPPAANDTNETNETSVDVVFEDPNDITGDGNMLGAAADALGEETTEEFIEQLIENSEMISSDVSATRSLTVSETESVMSLDIKYTGELKLVNFIVYDFIPKSFAEDAGMIEVTAPGATYYVVEDDPEFMFVYPELSPGDKAKVQYSIHDITDLDSIEDAYSYVYSDDTVHPDCNANGECESPPENEVNCPIDCLEAPCDYGRMRCWGDEVQACSESANGWIVIEECPHGCDSIDFVCYEEPEGADYVSMVFYIIIIILVIVFSWFYFIKHRITKQKPFESKERKDDLKDEKQLE